MSLTLPCCPSASFETWRSPEDEDLVPPSRLPCVLLRASAAAGSRHWPPLLYEMNSLVLERGRQMMENTSESRFELALSPLPGTTGHVPSQPLQGLLYATPAPGDWLSHRLCEVTVARSLCELRQSSQSSQPVSHHEISGAHPGATGTRDRRDGVSPRSLAAAYQAWGRKPGPWVLRTCHLKMTLFSKRLQYEQVPKKQPLPGWVGMRTQRSG